MGTRAGKDAGYAADGTLALVSATGGHQLERSEVSRRPLEKSTHQARPTAGTARDPGE